MKAKAVFELCHRNINQILADDRLFTIGLINFIPSEIVYGHEVNHLHLVRQ
jgi:hypothetical protein